MSDSQDMAMMEAMATTIHNRRHQLGLTVTTLAEEAGVNTGTISRTENSHTQLTLETATRLCTALKLDFWELVASSPFAHRIDPIESIGGLVTKEDVTALLEIFASNRGVCAQLLANWLDRVATILFPNYRTPNSHQLHIEFLTLLVDEHPVFQLGMQYPKGDELELILNTHALGGSLRKEDFELLLRSIGADPERYKKLDRQEKDVLRRLQSDTPDRVRFIDLVKLSKTLKVDLVGVYANTAGFLGRSLHPDVNVDSSQMRSFVSAFVIVTGWFRRAYPENQVWLDIIREDIKDELEKIVHNATIPQHFG